MKLPQFWFEPVAKAFALVPFFTTGLAVVVVVAVSVFFDVAALGSSYPPKIEI